MDDPDYPLVSCIMPVHGGVDRLPLLRLAIQSYCNQTYSNLELIVIDDATNPMPFHWDAIPHCRYYTAGDIPVGSKRNLACEYSRGEYICHFDSDDISAPDRISSQLLNLSQSSGFSILGYHTVYLYDVSIPCCYQYFYHREYCVGASLMYRRSWWRKHPFPDISIGEDEIYTCRNRSNRLTLDGTHKLVVLLHENNLSTRDQMSKHPKLFPQISVSRLPLFCQDIFLLAIQ